MIRNSEGEAPAAAGLSGRQPAAQALQAENLEPKSASEKYMASLWTEIIGAEQVKLPNRFLDLGGNSLTLNIILNRIETEKGVSLDAPLFFDDDRSSLFELAKELDALLENKPESSQEIRPVLRCA